MAKSSSISAAEANRQFSKIFRRAAEGETIVITDRGQPKAKLTPIDEPEADVAARREKGQAFLDALEARLNSQPAMNLGRFNRDWAYEE